MPWHVEATPVSGIRLQIVFDEGPLAPAQPPVGQPNDDDRDEPDQDHVVPRGPRDLLTPQELAEQLGVPVSMIHRWTSEQRIQSYKLELRTVRYRLEEVLRSFVQIPAAAGEIAARADALRVAGRFPPAAIPTDFITTADAARRLGVSRPVLDDMRERAPRGLPGSPTRIGKGKKNATWRWNAAKLPEWAAAYEAWRAKRGKHNS